MIDSKYSNRSVQIQQLYSGSAASLITSVLLAAILAYTQREVIGTAIVAGWLAAIIAVTLARVALCVAYGRAASVGEVSRAWLIRFRAGVLLAGVVWGVAGALMFPAHDVHHLMFLTFILAGLTVGGVISYSADLFSAIVFVVSSLLPFALRLLIEPGSLFVAMGVSGILFIGFVMVSLVHINRNLRDNTVLRLEALHSQRVLSESEAQFRFMLESSPIAVRIADAGGRRVVFANQGYAKLINHISSGAEGLDPRRYYTNPEVYDEMLCQILEGKKISDKLVELNIPNQGAKWALASYLSFRFEGGDAVLGWFYDITQLKQAELALQQSETRFRQMFERHASPMLLIAPDRGDIVNANHAAADYYGYPVEQFKEMNIAQINILTPEDIAAELRLACREERNYFVFPHRLANDEVRTVEVHSSPVEVDGRLLLFSIIHDITERKQLEEQMQGMAFYDALTKLPNRRWLFERLTKALASSASTRRHGALMFLDLDHFKTLNDLHGHDVGDQLLVEAARRIQTCIRNQDSVARLGGDEFVVMLEGMAEDALEAVAQAEGVAEQLRDALTQPYMLHHKKKMVVHHCSSSIGVVMFLEYEERQEQLLKCADIAMYRAKGAGRNTVRFFDPEMQAAIEMRAALEADLYTALEEQQFQLFYQVQVNALGQAQGAEALLRWQHPQRGLVSPMQFIPLAEEISLIVPIGLWVLDTACAQVKCWQNDALLCDLVLAVNVSARQFRQADFVAQVSAAVQRNGIPPHLIKLELTESLVLDDINDTITKMHALKEFGVTFAIDDFGTGYSSLSHLKRLPLDQIKIDQSFVRDINTDNADRVMVMIIVDLGMNFEVNVIAEGVETEEQFQMLKRYGCGSFQGYLFGRPLPLEEFKAGVLNLPAAKFKRSASPEI